MFTSGESLRLGNQARARIFSGGLMSEPCRCTAKHRTKRVVLTGGPGAGKTAVLEMLAHEICPHVVVSREAAGILFAGGFPRGPGPTMRRAAQRAIFHVQIELENMLADTNAALILFDRGVVDGSAYWVGPGDFWRDIGMAWEDALSRYDAVVHMRSPDAPNGYGHQNPLRTESPVEARRIDERILAAWRGHPHRFIIDATPNFLTKAERAIAVIRAQTPDCCDGQVTMSTGQPAPATTEPTTLPRTAGITLPTP
jgi:predicted ATPase